MLITFSGDLALETDVAEAAQCKMNPNCPYGNHVSNLLVYGWTLLIPLAAVVVLKGLIWA